MIRMLVSSALDRVFEPRSGQNKKYEIGICCFSAKRTPLKRKTADLLRTVCWSGGTCLLADCCFNEIALQKCI